MDQHIYHCATSDGVNLAYATIGDGPPLVKVANWLSHLDVDWISPVWRHWMEALSRSHQLIRYDERGCGLSDWQVDDFSFEAWVQDLETVVEASGVERFPLLGISQGGPIAIAYAVRHPERVSRLILYGSYARGKLHRGLSQRQLEEEQALVELARLGWGKENPAFRQVFSSLFLPEGTAEQWSWFNELQRLSSSPENAVRIMGEFNKVNVFDLAPQVQAPTLVLHARGDARIPFAEGQLLASRIPGARFVPLESKNHILLEHEPAFPQFVREVRAFLGLRDQEDGGRAVDGSKIVGMFQSAGVLFADMVGFTTLSALLSPDRMVALLDDVYSQFDRTAEKHALEKIRVIGDEYMAASGVPRPRPNHLPALADAALEMQSFVNGLPSYAGRRIQFRFGMGVGPLTAAMVGRSKLQYDVWGDTVNVASRMQSQGLPGRIQITKAARDLLQEQFTCEPRGTIDVKGVGPMETWLLTGRKS